MDKDTRAGNTVFEVEQKTHKFYYSQKETAWRLGISLRMLLELRDKHSFYALDSFHNTEDKHRKRMPLWCGELIHLIAISRSLTAQGVRLLTRANALKMH